MTTTTVKIYARGHCRRRYDTLRHAGRLPSTLIDPGPTRDLIALHVERGRTMRTLSRASGVHNKVLAEILDGTTTKILQRTADKVTAAPLPPSCVGCLRRVQALQRIGHPLADIAHAADCAPGAIQVALRRGRVIDHLAFALDCAYQRMQHISGGSKSATAWAASRAYASPAAWDGVDIDDPAARPLGVIRPRGHHAVDGSCSVCGTDLTSEQVRRHWVTCADVDCRRTARSRRDHTRWQAGRKRTTPVLPSRRCLWGTCGKEFTPTSGRQFHCTADHREQAKAASRPSRRAEAKRVAGTSQGREVAAA